MCSCRARIDRIVAGVPHAARALLAQIPLRSRSISHWRSCWPCRWLPTSARGHHCVTNAVRLARRQLVLNRMYGHRSLHCKHERYQSNHHTHVYPFNRLLLHSVCASLSEKEAAALYCADCNADFCEACSSKTHSTKLLAKHTVVQHERKPFVAPLPLCEKHRGRQQDLFCIDCNVRPLAHRSLIRCESTLHGALNAMLYAGRHV